MSDSDELSERERYFANRPSKADPPQGVSRSRLSVIPFSVLLPPLGELSSLQSLRGPLEKRLRELQSEISTSSGEVSKERLSEASMLNQVVQWLSPGESES